MPFKIIRNDITKVSADVIVNTANPKPIYASGTDRAIYEAAGADDVLAERVQIGEIARGDVAVTKAYKLNAKYIIHTVGPAWDGGNHNELNILESCYRKSLDQAKELGAESIAFPLIAIGVYGFPKDKALQIAVSVFSQFLLNNEMEIILVVFDKKAFHLSERLVGSIDSFIDANYIEEHESNEYMFPSTAIEESSIRSRFDEEEELAYARRIYSIDSLEECEDGMIEDFTHEPEEDMICMDVCLAPGMSLEDELANVGATFHEKLFEIIAEKGLDNTQVWKQSNLDRKHFSKIQCNANYHPNKKTVMALCIGLQLDINQARDLMARADWAFCPSSKMDLIVQKAIIDKNYDMMWLNTVLFKYTNETLGV